MNRIEYQGHKLTIESLTLSDQSCPAGDFLDGLEKRERRRIDALFALMGEKGEIRNREHFKRMQGSAQIFAFKSFQIRIPCFFKKGRRLILAYGLRKRSDKWKPAQLRRAEEYREWFLTQEGQVVMNNTWCKRQDGTPEDRREYEQERLIVDVTDTLYGLMEDSGLTKADLARVLGTSRAHVTQLFNGARNMTLRSVSDFAWASGYRVTLTAEPLRSGQYINAPVHVMKASGSRVVKMTMPGIPMNSELAELDPLAA